ncbi:hypothetical protein EV360DRAFT_76231 [Lentinula raphanica]|nr:hypothetical protein EV360DRAFT_76231 [Lentinula raphanica]
MEFTLSDIHPYDSTFSITTQNGSMNPMFIAGEVHLNRLAGDQVFVRGREMYIVDHGLAWRSLDFIASNGRTYKWDASGTHDFNLETHQGQVIAAFDGGHRHLFSSNEQATLIIHNPGELALEDIITTLVCGYTIPYTSSLQTLNYIPLQDELLHSNRHQVRPSHALLAHNFKFNPHDLTLALAVLENRPEDTNSRLLKEDLSSCMLEVEIPVLQFPMA